jgi:uncharacterized protein with PIN domain
MNAPLKFEIPANAKTTRCRSCNATITFVTTEKNRLMPVDVVGEHRGESHFAHCDNPKRFRKRDRVKGARP